MLSKTAGTPYRVQVFFTSGNIKKPIKGTNFRHIEKRELVFNVLTVDTMVLGFKKNKDKQHYHIGLKNSNCCKCFEAIHTLRRSKTFSAIYFCWRFAPFCCTLSGWIHNVAFLYTFLTAAAVIKSVRDTGCHPHSGQRTCSERTHELIAENYCTSF